MNWGNIVELNKLSQDTNTEIGKEKFYGFVTRYIDAFNNQAWIIFTNALNLSKIDYVENQVFWDLVYERLKRLDLSIQFYRLNEALRLSVLQKIIEDHQKKIKKNVKEASQKKN